MILVFHSCMWEYGEILASYGPERLSMAHTYHTAMDMGIPVAGHSDSPLFRGLSLAENPGHGDAERTGWALCAEKTRESA